MSNKHYHFLLLGGTGFIGRNLCNHLISRGVDVTVVSRNPSDDFQREFSQSLDIVRLGRFQKNKPDDLQKFTHAVFLASSSIPSSNFHNLTKEFSDNLGPAITFFETIAHNSPATKIIYMSSGGTIYGRTSEKPAKETDPKRPLTSYGMSKYVAELGLEHLARIYNLHYAIVRPANPVGPWQINSNQGFVAAAIRNHKKNEPILIYGDGTQIRDYLYIDDLSEAIYKISTDDRHQNNAWNVGSGIGHSINEILNMLSEVSGQPPKLAYVDKRECDLQYNVLDISKIKSMIGWTPKKSMEDIITLTWKSSNIS